MNIAIIYASKYGTTEKVAASMAENLKKTNEVELVSLATNPNPNINEFEAVILGASIYAGQASKKMKAFCKTNESVLLQKKLGLFVCGMHIDRAEREKELKEAYPEILQQNAIATGFMGGAFLFEKMNFIERMIIKKIEKTTTSVERIEWEAVECFVNTIEGNKK